MTHRVRGPLIALGVLTLAALIVPAVSSDPTAIDDVLAQRLLAPFATDASGTRYWLGTDRFGRDILARTLLAARISLLVGVLGSLVATALGVIIGATAGWSGRAVDRTLMSIADTFLAVPRLVLLLLCVTLWAPGMTSVVLVLGATGWMSAGRLVRAEVQSLRRAGFVEAAGVLGASGSRMLWRHVVPNALGPAVVSGTLGVGNAILLESGLAFLGLGVQPPTPSWGNMIAGGRDLIVTAPWVALAPGVALIITVWLATSIGESLRRPQALQRSRPNERG